MEDITRNSVERISLRDPSEFPHQLIEVLQEEPQNSNEEALSRWNVLGEIDIEDIVANSQNNNQNLISQNSTIKEYLKFQSLYFGKSLKYLTIEQTDGIYQGQVDPEELQQGIGRYVSSKNGDIYEGEWRNGYYHGYGRLIFGKDHAVDYYMGQWSNGRRNGLGI